MVVRLSITGHTGQNPSQYLQALHTVNWRAPSSKMSAMFASHFTCFTTEYSSYRESKPSKVAARKDIPRHNLSSSIQVVKWFAIFFEDSCRSIDFHTHVRECDSRPQRISVEWRRVNFQRPVRFWRIKALRPAVIEDRRVELTIDNML